MAAIVFCRVYSEEIPDLYGNMEVSIRSMIDVMMGNYTYTNYGDYNSSHSTLLMLHAIISTIFLISYLAAILTTIY